MTVSLAYFFFIIYF